MAPLLVALLVAISGWWASSTVKSAMQQQLTSELQTILTADVTALDIWITTQRRMALALASDQEIRLMTQSLITKRVSTGDPSPASREEVRAFRSYLQDRLSPLGYSFMVVDRGGGIICGPTEELQAVQLPEPQRALFDRLFSSNQSVLITPYRPAASGGRTPLDRVFDRWNHPNREWKLEGEETPKARAKASKQRQANRTRALETEGTRMEADRSESLMQVSAPIVSDGGEVLAALGLMIRPESEFTRILSVARSGQTGETFAFDRSGLLISQSRFDDQLRKLGLLKKTGRQSSALNLELRDPGENLLSNREVSSPPSSWPLTRMVSDAVGGGVGVDVEGFRDYRGVDVVGGWQWLPRYGFGVATKVDATEAYQPLAVLQWTFTTLFLMLLLCAVAMSLFSYLNLNLRQRVEEAALEAKKLGQYTLLERIGQGGMGTVFKARHALMRRPTAVKLLLPEKADPVAVGRFEREVQMTSLLSHPNTIQIYDYGHTPEGIFYYAMEYLEGISLKELVQEYGPLPEHRLIHILRQICASLREAHEAHLVHRDVKPANVYLCDRGGILDTVKVLDFGLVMDFREEGQSVKSKKRPLSVTGTPQFFSPEAIESPDSVDHRSDVYSLGALSYYLLTGEHVFEGQSAREICEKQVSESPPLPSSRMGLNYCSHLEGAIMRCLEKKPGARPQTVAQFLGFIESSAQAMAWTDEMAADWWDRHHVRSRIASHARQLDETVKIQPTIRVDLERRDVGKAG